MMLSGLPTGWGQETKDVEFPFAQRLQHVTDTHWLRINPRCRLEGVVMGHNDQISIDVRLGGQIGSDLFLHHRHLLIGIILMGKEIEVGVLLVFPEG